MLDSLQRGHDVGQLWVVNRHNDRHAIGIDHVGGRQVAQSCLTDQKFLEGIRVGFDVISSPIDVAHHVDDVGTHDFAVFFDIGLSDIVGVIDDGAGAGGKPPVERA